MKYRPTPPFIAAMAVLLAVATFSAFADDTVTWQHPVEYTNDSPLDVADIASTVIRYGVGTPANPPTTVSAITVLAPAVSAVIPRDPLVAGTVCYQAATRMKPVPPATSGSQSVYAPTAWLCKVQAAPAPKKPRPPRNVSVS